MPAFAAPEIATFMRQVDRAALTHAEFRLLHGMVFKLKQRGEWSITGQSWDTIARVCGVSKSTLSRAFTKLTDAGLLEITRNRTSFVWRGRSLASRQDTNTYTFRLPRTGSGERRDIERSQSRTLRRVVELTLLEATDGLERVRAGAVPGCFLVGSHYRERKRPEPVPPVLLNWRPGTL